MKAAIFFFGLAIFVCFYFVGQPAIQNLVGIALCFAGVIALQLHSEKKSRSERERDRWDSFE